MTYICSDKTGTLTQNKIQVRETHSADSVLREWFADSNEPPLLVPWISLLTAMAQRNDANASAHGKFQVIPLKLPCTRRHLRQVLTKRY